MTFLVMDDDDLDRDSLVAILSARASDVVGAHASGEALKLLSQTVFTAIFADVFVRQAGQLVPDGGVSLHGRLRGASPDSPFWLNRNTPIIFVSAAFLIDGSGSPFDFFEQFDLSGFLKKPFNEQSVFRSLSKFDVGGAPSS